MLRTWRFGLVLVFAVCTAPPLHAQEVAGYEIEGYQLTPEGGKRLKQADADLRSGLDALQRKDWRNAGLRCGRALSTYRSLGLPNTGRIAEWYVLAKACVADSEAMTGSWLSACSEYRQIGYDKSIWVRNAREMCAKYDPGANPALDKHDNYADDFARFDGQVRAMTALPEGSARAARVAELGATCDKLASYRDSVIPAAGAAAYCRGIVAFEQGKSRTACQILWNGAKYMESAVRRPMIPQQADHARKVRNHLEGLRSACANYGHAWPAFSAEWPAQGNS